jgi:2-succinyl-5-enolpyruvyl-6-hydroxy-3-cyclohexene-1-carboxylate synthase
MRAPNRTYLWTQCLVEELVRCGVDTFFVAPGSRSTPLTVAAARHPDAEVILHVDERGTAFAALGYGRAAGGPAAWITTSGTAVANGLPAVVEAGTDGVPMLLLTADRPPELRDTGANQTIDQVKIFGDYVRWQVDLPVPSPDIDPAYVLTTADQAVHRTRRRPPGPVHLNCSFRKPLEPVASDERVDLPAAVREWEGLDTPFTTYPLPTGRPHPGDLDALAERLADCPRGLVVAGRLDTRAAAEAVRALAERLGWPLLPDVTSRLRLGSGGGDGRVPAFDAVLGAAGFRAEADPDAVVQVGGRFASKRLRLFLRDSEPLVWAVARPDPDRIDPDHRVTHHLESAPTAFARDLAERLPPALAARDSTRSYRQAWRRASRRADRAFRQAWTDESLSEPLVARLLTDHIPEDHALVTASSMPVRDVNRFGSPDGAGVPVFANRGASGIDGTVATTAGILHARSAPATLLIGDLALWHDLNSLALVAGRAVVVVVVNNDGGGIFHKLPIRDYDDVFEPYFTTPHGRSFREAAAAFGIGYARPTTPDRFVEAYREAARRPEATLVEVRTDRDDTEVVRERLDRRVEEAVDGS